MGVMKTDLGMHILIVEDNDINLDMIGMTVESFGCTFDTAINGKLALDAIKHTGKMPSDTFDAIIMDVQMPVMDGHEATRKIRKIWSSDGIKIIALTAHDIEKYRQDSMDAGMDYHMAKPYDPHQLNAILSEIKAQKNH